MFESEGTVDIRAINRRGIRIRTIPEVEPTEDWRDPVRHDDYDSCETFNWPAHEEGLRELEDEDTEYQRSAPSGSILTTMVIWAAALVLFATSALSYFTR